MSGKHPAKTLREKGKHLIPVIDLFAGPGGLGEGFSSYAGERGSGAFRIALSVEKDPLAHKTLELRAFFRQFTREEVPDAYYSVARRPELRDELFRDFPAQAHQARHEAWCAEMGVRLRDELKRRVKRVLRNAGGDVPSVLIGGPPCQAYSLVGRSRNRGNPNYDPSADHRHTLYREYLSVLASQQPDVFVMENVKGLLSAKYNDESMFDRIVEDLSSPGKALRRASARRDSGYRIFPLVSGIHGRQLELGAPPDEMSRSFSPREFIVRAEEHGIPQARHRVILLGVRESSLSGVGSLPQLGSEKGCVAIEDAIEDLPRLRSGVSGGGDDHEAWYRIVLAATKTDWWHELRGAAPDAVDAIERRLLSDRERPLPREDSTLAVKRKRTPLMEVLRDPRMTDVANHTTRSHMPEDIARYLFAATFAQVIGESPVLSQFPKELLPRHQNVKTAMAGGNFADRFRVQLRGRPSTTITSHIAKDGHYYIHYDPAQCRSLTVREAARLQTFPDNYIFCGPRTSQYQQVGNAVPPLLAGKIASIVYAILRYG